ncbi:MAG: peptidylprolyl isomerase [Acidobacteriota bacterium]|nr:peptidylprolyl isomerase [Acidobacteriota bacterium]MDH3523638.1 peptidylprolyl isomerase [Acidobacteriota bacterium]
MRRRLAGVLLLLGCAGVPEPVVLPPAPAGEVPHLEERALLLLLVDQQLFDPFTVERVRALGSEMRIELARSLGRAGDLAARPVLEDLLLDGDPEVRREAAFALGVLGDGEAIGTLARAARDPDGETGRLAVEALAKLDAPLERVLGSVQGLRADAYWARLVPSLARLPAPAALPTVRRALLEGGPAVYGGAMYALAREPDAASLPILRELLADPDPWLRSLAARALGRIGEAGDLERLAPLLEERESGPVVQALQSARRLVAGGLAAPPPGWAPRLLSLLDDPRAGVRLSAIETAGAWGADAALGAALRERFETAAGRERELALLALAAARHPRAKESIGAASLAADAVLRQRAAAAAGLVEDRPVLKRLLADPAPAVRAAAFGELLGLDGVEASLTARQALADPDPTVRAGAFEWAREHPLVPVVELLAALGGMGETDVVEAQLAALGALEARAGAAPEEWEAVVAALTLLAEGADFVLRRRAGETLVRLGKAAPPVGPVASTRTLAVYRDLVRRAWPERTVRLSTSRGDVDLRLECRQAPLTCVNFLQLVGVGFYDGLTFHRVVPDFVVQGGDPRGDGFGGPGYMIRDEINRLRYERGRVGMALAGPHTGGSQFFITLSPQPHLDGGYTIFGRVVAGDELLDELVQGDVIESAREIAVGD